MIQLTVLVKRNPSLSIEEFHERWREHGRTIANEPTLARHIRRYEQHHRIVKDYENGDTYDGLALQQYDDMDGFVAFISEPKYAELIQPDEETLLDMSKLVVIFTTPGETFIG